MLRIFFLERTQWLVLQMLLNLNYLLFSARWKIDNKEQNEIFIFVPILKKVYLISNETIVIS